MTAMEGRDSASPAILVHWARCEATCLPSRFMNHPQMQWRLARIDCRAGQVITLDLPVRGGNMQRTDTISPSRSLRISTTVKAQSESIRTRRMLEHLKPGMKIMAYGPSGIFRFLDLPGLCGERLAHFPGLSLEGDLALEVER